MNVEYGELFMERTPVSSSNLASVGYAPESYTLEIEFNGGGIYQYYEVPSHIHSELMGADSLGSYHHHCIKGIYSFAKV